MEQVGIGIAIGTVLIALVSYSLYIRDVLRGKTRPHAITWLIWAALNGFIFYEQWMHGAGPGAWVTAIASAANALIFLLALRYGERNVTHFDWLCLTMVVALFGIWSVNADPTLAVMMAIVIFIVGLLPTVRKVYEGGASETIATFFLNGVKFLFALLALSSFTFVTAAYPITLFIVNISFAVYLLVVRRRSKSRKRRKAPSRR